MILLDTNVVSAMMRLPQEPRVRAWLETQDEGTLYTCTPGLFEIYFGTLLLPAGRRRQDLEAVLATVIDTIFAKRILDFDAGAAKAAANIRLRQFKSGLNPDITDSQIAGIAVHHNIPIATRNTRDFASLGIPLVNPWE